MTQRAFQALLLVAAAAIGSSAQAQESSFVTDAVLINPGARSIALGGAFAAIADDATAALANPAGLVQILRPEISAEIRGSAITSDSDLPFEEDAGVSGLGFLSFVFPAKSWAGALYTHQLASLDFSFTGSEPFTRQLTVQSYSAAAGFQITENLSLGAGASYYDADFGREGLTDNPSDTSWGWNFGILWNVTADWKLAGFYRQGPEFESQPRVPSAGSSLIFPDIYRIAAAFQPGGGGVTIGIELDQVGSNTEPTINGSLVSDGGTEVHLGIEYAILKWKPVVAFRAGMWREPGGEQRVVENTVTTSAASRDTAGHVSLGFGFAFSKFQMDLGADFSDRAVVGSLSMVISF